ncbi:sulfite exporter TauE/SafE family protein [Aliamphritea hakodatensis]|uniref:sulfite exporter TauE/SafE family protein n=1 Tax=Aliamphritea hakodatensis TaxID=2895352 RepID=UPI0022FD714B|nr:sulfite exporter TauE/SafE family protein [Aliamphritea hakodatensis]
MGFELIILTVAGFLTGFSKFSVGGMGLLILPVLMLAFPGTAALGIIVPLFMMTDALTMWPYRKGADWGFISRLVPMMLAGILAGSLLLTDMDVQLFSLLLGGLILLALMLGFVFDRLGAGWLRKPSVMAVMGFFTGIVGLLANAAGPLVSLFLLEQKLSKRSYVSTRCWMATLTNLAKVPVLMYLGILTQDSLEVSVLAVPGLLLGGLIGYCFLGTLSAAQFKWIIRGLAAVAATKLLLFS